MSPLDEEDLFVRAKKILSMAELIGCNKYITPHELVKVFIPGFFLNVDQLISLTEILYREKIIQKNKEHSARKNQEQ